jgi:hypothetical protein
MTDKSSIGWNEGQLTTANSKLILRCLLKGKRKLRRPATLKQWLTRFCSRFSKGTKNTLG